MEFVFRRSYRGPIKLAVFDWAGTTVDYGCMAPAAVFIEVFRLRGLTLTDQQARGPMGLGKLDHLRALTQIDEIAKQWRNVHARPCTEADVVDMFEKEFSRLESETIARFATLIPNTVEAVKKLRDQGILIGSSTGYSRDALEINVQAAKQQGYEPDANFCAGDVPKGRPEPWMVYLNMQATRTFPPEAVVKIGDTVPDIAEGLNAGTWTIGVTKSGNEVGFSEQEIASVSDDVLATRIRRATEKLRQAGAHYVVETVADVPAVVDEIQSRVRRGERP